MNDLSEANEAAIVRHIMKRIPPAPSPAPAHTVPNMYSTPHYYESPLKRLKR